MNLTAVIMVKNEIDVIRDCCGHLSALFDDVVIIDHRSTDGTRQYLDDLSAYSDRFHVYDFLEPGYYQTQIMTWAVKSFKECRNADWIFLLDADEVLPFENRSQFEEALNEYASTAIIKMHWKNLIPKDYSIDGIIDRNYIEPNATSIYHKVAFQPSLLPISDYVIAQGNHTIYAGSTSKELPSTNAFCLYHIPIRSSKQLSFKVDQGTAAYTKMGRGRDKSFGTHWFQIADHIKKHGLDVSFLNGLAFHYGETTDLERINMPYEKIIQNGGQLIDLRMAYQALPENDGVITQQDKIAAMLKDMESSQSTDIPSFLNVSITMNKDHEISFMNNSIKSSYSSLDWRVLNGTEGDGSELLASFIEPSTWGIESLTPTAWGGHIPFLFSLVTLMKPRIYAELGSHNGASFFAACQAMQRNEYGGKAVAIDLWQGDEHAGFYAESVFKNFKYILSTRYSDVGEFLRMSFDEASSLFEDGSIDLLHIDGLHTYEAVKSDYETWRSKVTKNGVIIFHDTNVYEREFGVWQLWDEIKNDAVSFNFKHTHGLGVLAFGSADENPVVKLLQMINCSSDLQAFMETYYSRLGELSNLEAVSNNKKKASASSSSKKAKMFGKLAVLRSSIRNRLVIFIKSVPVLRKLAYTILRYVRS